ncbi:GntR family transcriptional regulator [Lacisediminihabitans changchengi]|uniref:GntR family transcriptional regulator n=1 Tax=Lacisediminihabitans changchengi TaxID=2787634 RepID=A0A934W335_9MICO|nr:GntR family transcriptional regulator [Lacisediminihabitans changchengi]MBK4346140.1 GntR family transcriptional regulator [Lacisediminihabitans changchengi]
MIVVDPRSAVPPFEQIRVQLVAQVQSGELPPDARLPTVRKLASDLRLAPNTVARAYRELERAGVIETRGRHGTFVAPHADPVRRQAQSAAESYARQAVALGLGVDDAVRLLRDTFEAGAVR